MEHESPVDQNATCIFWDQYFAILKTKGNKVAAQAQRKDALFLCLAFSICYLGCCLLIDLDNLLSKLKGQHQTARILFSVHCRYDALHHINPTFQQMFAIPLKEQTGIPQTEAGSF